MIDHNNRICSIEGCDKLGQPIGSYLKDGTKVRRDKCQPHHFALTANKAGHKSTTAWLNVTHRYRKFRKDYCENIDGRLGFECTSTIFWPGMLDVDHKDGNHDNNNPDNLQTLCKCCHAYKGNINKDYKSKKGYKSAPAVKFE